MNELNVFNTFVEVELTTTGLNFLNEKDNKVIKIFNVKNDSICLYKTRIYNENKLKTTIQELMFLFKELPDFNDEFPIYGNLKIL